MRAFLVVNCQSALVWLALRSCIAQIGDRADGHAGWAVALIVRRRRGGGQARPNPRYSPRRTLQEDDALLQERPNDIRHTVGRRARRKKPEILPCSVHQINVAGMVDRVFIARRRNLGVIDFVRTGGLPDGARIAG